MGGRGGGGGGAGGGGGMKNTIRCCISCILPCGALDVVRIVHSDGRVEEISGSVRAGEIMKLHPKHVLKKPCSTSSYCDTDHAVSPKIVVVPPDAELQRGKIYFLMPAPPDKLQSRSSSSRKKRRPSGYRDNTSSGPTAGTTGIQVAADLVVSDRYLSEILSEKLSSQKQDYRRRGRVGVWRPHLESISETPAGSDSSSS